MDDRASYVNGTAALESTEMTEASATDFAADGDGAGTETEVGPRARLTPSFLAELAAAMRSAAERERERIANVMAEDAANHIEKVRGRAGIETEELRRLAEDDIRAVDEWSAAEVDRVHSEAAQRIEDRRASLEDYLRQHETIIESEIQGVEASVRGYGETLDRFFEGLAASGDPSDIVRRAETLPAPPDLDQVRSSARATAVAVITDQPESYPIEASAVSTEVSTDTESLGHGEPGADTSGYSATADSGSGNSFTGSDGSSETSEDTEGSATFEASRETDDQAAIETSGESDDQAGSADADRSAAVDEGQSGPVGVMDPVIGAGATWPATFEPTADEPKADEPAAAEPVAAAPGVDHTSAAVRLLRSVAPWTAPTHALHSQPSPAGTDRPQG